MKLYYNHFKWFICGCLRYLGIMSSPFPGINPYLENSDLWTGVHGRIIVSLADFLSPQVRPKYFVAIEERLYQTTIDDRVLVGIPDVIVQSLPTNQQKQNLTVISPESTPKKVKVPLPETVKERYLEDGCTLA